MRFSLKLGLSLFFFSYHFSWKLAPGVTCVAAADRSALPPGVRLAGAEEPAEVGEHDALWGGGAHVVHGRGGEGGRGQTEEEQYREQRHAAAAAVV